MKRFIPLAVLFASYFPLTAQNQNPTIQYLPNYSAARHPVYDVGQLKKSKEGIQRFIVKLKGGALGNGRISANQINDLHIRFREDVNNLINAQGRTDTPTEILFEYRLSFNGFALRGSNAAKEKIRGFDYVESVTEDKEVKVIDAGSNAAIKADQVWSTYGLQGNGIRIGIIDTGIDYNHADLGGGFGPGFKVTGGFDFVNWDTDPLDDHGHGTHVAGIAAANGPNLKGVAPQATLYGFKVLDGNGSGFDSWVMAGVERTLDPDQNPATDDKMHVVNMSLGRSGLPDDPMNEAVNTAISQGVVFVLAAGNAYDFFTVSTPGSAAKGISVAASDNIGYTAWFSSKGPTSDFQLKPDLSAPGVRINSSFPGNNYRMLDGTSMASPHVAGAAALVLERHPSWTPAQVKAALMNTARTTPSTILEQGAGGVDVLAAIASDLFASPASISLGRLNASIPMDEKVFTITLTNDQLTTQNVQLKASDALVNSGISIRYSENPVTVPAKGSRDIAITFNIPNTLPFKNFPEIYSGHIVATGQRSIIKIPVGLIHTPMTSFVFDEELPFILHVVGTGWSNVYFPTQSPMEIPVPPGTYEIAAMYFDFSTMVIKEETEINAGKNTEIKFAKSEAKNQITFHPKDINDQDLLFTEGLMIAASIKGVNGKFSASWLGGWSVLTVSDVKNYRISFRASGSPWNDVSLRYEIAENTPVGILKSQNLTNDPEDLSPMNITNPGAQEGGFQNLVYYFASDWFILYNPPQMMRNPFRILYSGDQSPNDFFHQYLKLEPLSGETGTPWQVNSLQFRDNVVRFRRNGVAPFDLPKGEIDYSLGASLMSFNGTAVNTDGAINISNPLSPGFFTHHLGDHARNTLTYTLKTGGNLITSGELINHDLMDYLMSMQGYPIESSAQPKKYDLTFNYDGYSVQGKNGTAKAMLTFDMGKDDKNSPYFRSMHLESSGKSVDHFSANNPATLKLNISDDCSAFFWEPNSCTSTGVAQVNAKFKANNETTWQTLALQMLPDGQYQAKFQTGLPEGYYDLMISATDKSGNAIEYTATPAFKVGESPTVPNDFVTLISPVHEGYTGKMPTFSWFPIEDATYRLEVSTSEDFSTHIIDTQVMGTSYTSTIPLEMYVTHYWRVSATAQGKSIQPSGKRKFYPQVTHPVQAIFPENNSSALQTSIVFKWTVPPFARNYTIEISKSPLFNTVVGTGVVWGNEFSMIGLEDNTMYYWRVLTQFDQDGWDYEAMSDVFVFNTGKITETEKAVELLSGLSTYPNPFDRDINISFHLRKPGPVSLRVVDPTGREIFVEHFAASAGDNVIQWKGENAHGMSMQNGVYLGRIQTGTEVHHVKMVLRR